ncbi:LOW QUALITY PROTEIN: uncharacterized protein EMH_0041290 [Eimeria mitis]|uniref:Uncharacterized protein n=1 Tax=Eimeria mitis TaxID=44415 RepID=U6KD17_9EIME|nr:LOW QUALITY PROTEIN: uncharacterized protein EMH_0041290 [Eimeria mitis]CDJ35900.1 hypothetical protein EMH_0041290 [Eimeria mitis]
MHCMNSESPGSKGTEWHDSIDKQSRRVAGSGEPAACVPAQSSCTTKKNAELDRPLNQLIVTELGCNAGVVGGLEQENELSKCVSSDARCQDCCPRKRGASHTSAPAESEGATDMASEGERAKYTPPRVEDRNSGVQPRPAKCFRSAQELSFSGGAPAGIADPRTEEHHLENTGLVEAHRRGLPIHEPKSTIWKIQDWSQ